MNNKSDKKIIIMVVAMALVVCAGSVLSGSKTTNEESSSSSSSASASSTYTVEHLRDQSGLYASQNDEEVKIMYLTVSSGNSEENTNHTWSEINEYSVYDYENMGVDRYKVEGLLQVGDENGPVSGELGYGLSAPNATVQIRGQSSSASAQKNYKISLKGNYEWNGQQTIALNKHVSEGLRFRNKLAYDLMRQIDQMMSLRTTFVHLYVKDNTSSGNGEFVDYGLYTQVEQLNKSALKVHGLNRSGQLYKVNYFEFYRYEDAIKLNTDPTYDVSKFEEYLEIKGDDDHTKLINMLEAVNNYSLDIDDILDKYFDIENLSYWMAFHILMGNLDTQSRNVYLYSPLNSNTWYFYSWDNDGMMRELENNYLGRETSSWEKGVSNYWGNILFQRCLKSEKYREALDNAINDLRSNALSYDNVDRLTKKYASVVKSYALSGPDKSYLPITESEYDDEVNNFATLIDVHYQNYLTSLQTPMPFYINLPTTANGKLTLSWNNSYDIQGDKITYKAIVSSTPNMSNVIGEYEGEWLNFNIDMPSSGQYFIKVTATDSNGNEIGAFDTYPMEDSTAYSTYCFYVNSDGTVSAYGS